VHHSCFEEMYFGRSSLAIDNFAHKADLSKRDCLDLTGDSCGSSTCFLRDFFQDRMHLLVSLAARSFGFPPFHNYFCLSQEVNRGHAAKFSHAERLKEFKVGASLSLSLSAAFCFDRCLLGFAKACTCRSRVIWKVSRKGSFRTNLLARFHVSSFHRKCPAPLFVHPLAAFNGFNGFNSELIAGTTLPRVCARLCAGVAFFTFLRPSPSPDEETMLTTVRRDRDSICTGRYINSFMLLPRDQIFSRYSPFS